MDTLEGQTRPVWLSTENAGGTTWVSLSTAVKPRPLLFSYHPLSPGSLKVLYHIFRVVFFFFIYLHCNLLFTFSNWSVVDLPRCASFSVQHSDLVIHISEGGNRTGSIVKAGLHLGPDCGVWGMCPVSMETTYQLENQHPPNPRKSPRALHHLKEYPNYLCHWIESYILLCLLGYDHRPFDNCPLLTT